MTRQRPAPWAHPPIRRCLVGLAARLPLPCTGQNPAEGLPGYSHQQIVIGVIAPIDPRVETPEEVRDLVLEAAAHIPVGRLGTTHDCGFPFSDDTSTGRDTAFAKVRARVLSTALAAAALGAG